MSQQTEIAERLQAQRTRLRDAAVRAGRDPGDITLIAVSKKHTVDAILCAYAAGQRDFGENYVQELAQKASQLSQYADIRWHLIGHLQTNKARLVVPLVHSIHTVASLRLVSELGKRSTQRANLMADGPPLDVLIEVNVSGEESKSGCRPDEISLIAEHIEAERGLRLRGLMTMPPYDPDPEKTRPHFECLRELRDVHGGTSRLPHLSMGMSHDVHVAVETGATLVRIGSFIFGERARSVV